MFGVLGGGVGTGERAIGMAETCLIGERLPAATVQRIERLVGGDVVVEGQVLRFIGARYGAKSLVCLPRHVAAEVCRRPADFVRAARRWCEPELELRVEG